MATVDGAQIAEARQRVRNDLPPVQHAVADTVVQGSYRGSIRGRLGDCLETLCNGLLARGGPATAAMPSEVRQARSNVASDLMIFNADS
ncbi:MAG: hypothetical protein IPJ33_15850 [Gammaproteobacteria bacterium]|nr:hypothetical protein [Gammaproteobacteria bacterium]